MDFNASERDRMYIEALRRHVDDAYRDTPPSIWEAAHRKLNDLIDGWSTPELRHGGWAPREAMQAVERPGTTLLVACRGGYWYVVDAAPVYALTHQDYHLFLKKAGISPA